ncbi:hypothetical protein FACS189492_0160 [Clostridia bacterium]|nr:hypothetical protein FACS189492_0160 [Clostridia bacterium]
MIYIITGHYGSGKTEIAINLALSLKIAEKAVAIIDLDLVNPYFRTKDAERLLTDRGIRVISPQYANTNVDLPVVPAEIISALQGDGDVVIDVGGDDDGAIALGQYNAYFQNRRYEMYFVINQKRPMTANADDTVRLLREVERASRLRVTGLIDNTNLKDQTTAQDIDGGKALTFTVSRATGIPQIPRMPLTLFLNLPWEKEVL